MNGMEAAYLTAAVGLSMLVVVVLRVSGRFRRFSAAAGACRAELAHARAGLAHGAAALRRRRGANS